MKNEQTIPVRHNDTKAGIQIESATFFSSQRPQTESGERTSDGNIAKEVSKKELRIARLAEQRRTALRRYLIEHNASESVAKMGTFVWDESGSTIQVSEGFLAVLEWGKGEQPLTPSNYLKKVHPEDRHAVINEANEFFEGRLNKDVSLHSVHRYICKGIDAKTKWIKVTGVFEAGIRKEGSILQVTGWIQDVTAQKEAQLKEQLALKELKQRSSELEKMNKELMDLRVAEEKAYHQKSHFLAMVSHEVRTPVSGLSGALELLADTRLDSEQRPLVRTALGCGQNLHRILDNIIEIDKIESGHFQVKSDKFRLDAMASSVHQFWLPLLESKALRFRVESTTSGFKGSLRGDTSSIRQVVDNFISNAIKFTDAGQISVFFELLEDDLGGNDDSRCILRVEVKDTGRGISEMDQNKLFDDYVRIDDSVEGSGLGLHISNRLVTLLGGTCGVESEIGKGSNFWFKVPVHLESVEKLRTIEDYSSCFIRSKLLEAQSSKVLLVEDVKINQLVTRRMLEKLGLNVTVAENGEDALELMKADSFNLVLMDASMPKLNGADTTRKIRANRRTSSNLPVVGLTALSPTENSDFLLEAGMNEVLVKPVSLNTLHTTLSHYFRFSQDMELDLVKNSPIREFIDPIVFDTLVAGLEKNEIEGLVSQLLLDIEDQSQKLIKAAQESDQELIKQSAHALKGVAGSFGAKQLFSFSINIENLCKRGQWEETVNMVSERTPRISEFTCNAYREFLLSRAE